MKNIDAATSDNICLYMAVNQLNKETIADVCKTAKSKRNIRAASFNFHTPYSDTEALALTKQDKKNCCAAITDLIRLGYPVLI